MSKVIVFDINGIETIIQCDDKEQIIEAYKKYISYIETDISKINFIYKGKKINEKLSFDKIANSIDKKRNIINISLEGINNKNNINEKVIKSKDIICPICNESIILKIKDYKIFLSDCINGHKINNILLNEYENTQKIGLSKLICDLCKIQVKEINMNKLYKCYSCGINVCSSCKSKHDKNHNIIIYENKNYVCHKHNKNFTEYCTSCKQNICYKCQNEHKNHDIIYYEDIIPKEYNMKKEKNELRQIIDKLNNDIKKYIKMLNDIMNKFEIYYKIVIDIYNNYTKGYKNYQILKNVNEFKNYNYIIIKNINQILDQKDFSNISYDLMSIYNRMNIKINEENYQFKVNPNLKFKYDILSNVDAIGINDIFEFFKSYKDQKEYLALKNKKHELEIFTLYDNKRIIRLKGHNSKIYSIRYFINNKNYNEYLVSADQSKVIIIWDITNNYNSNYRIQTKYLDNISSCLLVFPHNNNENYIVTSTYAVSNIDDESITKIYSLNNCKFLKNIANTNNISINYLLSWYNKSNNKYYIIQITNFVVIINDLIEGSDYANLFLKDETKYNNGIIYSKYNIDYLCCSSEDGNIYIWDLYGENLFKLITVKNNCSLRNIIQWNDKYIIVVDKTNKSFKIIDIDQYKVISEIKNNGDEIFFIKKLYHPLYKESLMTVDSKENIKLFII